MSYNEDQSSTLHPIPNLNIYEEIIIIIMTNIVNLS